MHLPALIYASPGPYTSYQGLGTSRIETGKSGKNSIVLFRLHYSESLLIKRFSNGHLCGCLVHAINRRTGENVNCCLIWGWRIHFEKSLSITDEYDKGIPGNAVSFLVWEGGGDYLRTVLSSTCALIKSPCPCLNVQDKYLFS
ncbi:hypothetical protein TNIN_259791 [Trichonephila inaurata madagascariensis]|uniref:Uncharacterized protein n=1 Tax=Trichonephila inaurata madagascariensis TaxID=2747483 RepID=A0A8X6IDG3_9ARAC|nr:hypothetical protein TNIN_259791 [Trichonephila inaurata madagascariensis]